LFAAWLGFDRDTTVEGPIWPLVVVGLLYCLILGYGWANNDRHLELRRERPYVWLAKGVASVLGVTAMVVYTTVLLMGTIAQWIDGAPIAFPAKIIKVDDSHSRRAGCRRHVHLSDLQNDRVIRVCAVHQFSPRDIGADLPVWSKVRVRSRRTVLGEVVERVELVRD
jgi:hypothetical protein